jgi:hypothetical protein
MGTKNLTDGKLVIFDGGASGAQQSLEVPIELGNLRWTEPNPTLEVHARGALVEHNPGREQPCEVSFSFAYQTYTQDTSSGSTETSPTPVDALKGEGGASSWVSTRPRPYSVDLEFRVTSYETGIKHELVLFPDFHRTGIEVNEEEDVTKVNVTGKILGTAPTVTRVASF